MKSYRHALAPRSICGMATLLVVVALSPQAQAQSLFGTNWRLTEINGRAVNSTRAYIEFDGNTKRISGDGGCNRFGGNFEIDHANIRFSQTFSTKRACIDQGIQQIENSFLNALPQVTGFQIQGNLLRLQAQGRTILAFRSDSTGSKKEITFKQGSAGSGRTKDGSRFSFTEWESSDGVWLTLRTEKRGSLRRARAALVAALRGKSVLERIPKLDPRGQNVGERVVAKYYWKQGKKYQNIIVWTEGSDVNYLESSSLEHVLAFEKLLAGEKP